MCTFSEDTHFLDDDNDGGVLVLGVLVGFAGGDAAAGASAAGFLTSLATAAAAALAAAAAAGAAAIDELVPRSGATSRTGNAAIRSAPISRSSAGAPLRMTESRHDRALLGVRGVRGVRVKSDICRENDCGLSRRRTAKGWLSERCRGVAVAGAAAGAAIGAAGVRKVERSCVRAV